MLIQKNKKKVVLVVLGSLFFSFCIQVAFAAPVKVLVDAAHASGAIYNTLRYPLLGENTQYVSYTSEQFIVHKTSLIDGAFSVNPADAPL